MSTLKAVNVQHPSASTTNIVNDSSGNVAVGNNLTVAGTATVTGATTFTGNQTIGGNLTVTGALVPSSSFKRNRIINGNFNIWQRGTSFTSSSVNEYFADRWRTEGNTINSVISQQTFTVGQTAVPGYPTYYCRVTTSSAPSGSWAFTQRIECPQNISGDGTYTLSFWAKAVSGTIAAGTFNYGINTASNNSPALTTTWQKITVTTTLSGVSQASGYLTMYIVSVGSSVSSLSVDIANVQVESGTLATPYEVQIYSDQLAQCQRYYFASGGSYYAITLGTYAGGSFPVVMRTAPTMTFPGLTAGTQSSLTTGPTAWFFFYNASSGYGVTASAEL